MVKIFIDMKKKLIITESQMTRLKSRLLNENYYTTMVKTMKEDLDANYAPSQNYVNEGGEFHAMPMFEVVLTKEVITPKALYEYMLYKHGMKEDFTQQVIRDWFDGKISEDYQLSKLVAM
jgi:hypothetical protein